jgi:chitin synthase
MHLDMTKGTKALCRDFIGASNWTNKEMAIGNSKVFLAEASWRSLEDELRTIEDALKDENKAKRRGAGSVSGSRAGDFYDGESVYSSEGGGYYDDDQSYAGDDNESHYGSEFKFDRNAPFNMAKGDVEMGQIPPGDRGFAKSPLGADSGIAGTDVDAKPKKKKMTRARCQWLCITFSLTWCCPTFILWLSGKKRKDVIMAWREKVALCIIIFLMCCFLLFFIIIFGKLICPRQQVYSKFEVAGFTDVDNMWVYAYGRVFQINDIVRNHMSSYNIQKYQWQDYAGQDVGGFFYKAAAFDRYCPGLARPPTGWDNWPSTRPPMSRATYPYHRATDPSTGEPRLYLEYMNQYAKARVAWQMDYIASTASQNTKYVFEIT